LSGTTKLLEEMLPGQAGGGKIPRISRTKKERSERN